MVDYRGINESRYIRGIGRVDHDTSALYDQRGIPIVRGEDARRFFRRILPIRLRSRGYSLDVPLVGGWIASWGSCEGRRNDEPYREKSDDNRAEALFGHSVVMVRNKLRIGERAKENS